MKDQESMSRELWINRSVYGISGTVGVRRKYDYPVYHKIECNNPTNVDCIGSMIGRKLRLLAYGTVVRANVCSATVGPRPSSSCNYVDLFAV